MGCREIVAGIERFAPINNGNPDGFIVFFKSTWQQPSLQTTTIVQTSEDSFALQNSPIFLPTSLFVSLATLISLFFLSWPPALCYFCAQFPRRDRFFILLHLLVEKRLNGGRQVLYKAKERKQPGAATADPSPLTIWQFTNPLDRDHWVQMCVKCTVMLAAHLLYESWIGRWNIGQSYGSCYITTVRYVYVWQRETAWEETCVSVWVGKRGDLLAYPRLQTHARVHIHKRTFARRKTACAKAKAHATAASCAKRYRNKLEHRLSCSNSGVFM